jgi:hypothetical protein
MCSTARPHVFSFFLSFFGSMKISKGCGPVAAADVKRPLFWSEANEPRFPPPPNKIFSFFTFSIKCSSGERLTMKENMNKNFASIKNKQTIDDEFLHGQTHFSILVPKLERKRWSCRRNSFLIIYKDSQLYIKSLYSPPPISIYIFIIPYRDDEKVIN